MEKGILYLLIVLGFLTIWGLIIALCVKLWGMCNDVKRIVNLLEDRFKDRLNP